MVSRLSFGSAEDIIFGEKDTGIIEGGSKREIAGKERKMEEILRMDELFGARRHHKENMECKLKNAIDNNKDAMIGLNHITELQSLNNVEPPKYKCNLCDIHVGLKFIITHITGLQHRSKYMEKYHPEKYEKMESVTARAARRSLMEEHARDIEDATGREQINVELLDAPAASWEGGAKPWEGGAKPSNTAPPAEQISASTSTGGQYQGQTEPANEMVVTQTFVNKGLNQSKQPLANQEFEEQPLANQEFEEQPLANQEFEEQPLANQEFKEQPLANQEFKVQPLANQGPEQQFESANQGFQQREPNFEGMASAYEAANTDTEIPLIMAPNPSGVPMPSESEKTNEGMAQKNPRSRGRSPDTRPAEETYTYSPEELPLFDQLVRKADLHSPLLGVGSVTELWNFYDEVTPEYQCWLCDDFNLKPRNVLRHLINIQHMRRFAATLSNDVTKDYGLGKSSTETQYEWFAKRYEAWHGRECVQVVTLGPKPGDRTDDLPHNRMANLEIQGMQVPKVTHPLDVESQENPHEKPAPIWDSERGVDVKKLFEKPVDKNWDWKEESELLEMKIKNKRIVPVVNITQFQSGVRWKFTNFTNIGANWLTEFWSQAYHDRVKMPFYTCSLCEELIDCHDTIEHCLSIRHLLLHMRHRYPDMYEMMLTRSFETAFTVRRYLHYLSNSIAKQEADSTPRCMLVLVEEKKKSEDKEIKSRGPLGRESRGKRKNKAGKREREIRREIRGRGSMQSKSTDRREIKDREQRKSRDRTEIKGGGSTRRIDHRKEIKDSDLASRDVKKMKREDGTSTAGTSASTSRSRPEPEKSNFESRHKETGEKDAAREQIAQLMKLQKQLEEELTNEGLKQHLQLQSDFPAPKLQATQSQANVPSANLHAPQLQFTVPPPNLHTPQLQASVTPPNLHAPQLQASVPPPNLHAPPLQFTVPPPNLHALQLQSGVPPPYLHAPQLQAGVLPPKLHAPQLQASVPPPKLHAPQLQAGVPLPNVHAPQLQASVPPQNLHAPQLQVGVPPPNLHAPQLQASVPPPNIHAPPLQFTVPPTYLDAPQLQSGVPPPYLHAPQLQAGVPPPNLHVFQLQANAPPPNIPAPPPNIRAPPFQASVPAQNLYALKLHANASAPNLHASQLQTNKPALNRHTPQLPADVYDPNHPPIHDENVGAQRQFASNQSFQQSESARAQWLSRDDYFPHLPNRQPVLLHSQQQDKMEVNEPRPQGLVQGQFSYRRRSGESKIDSYEEFDMRHLKSRGSVDKFDNRTEQIDHGVGHVKRQGPVDNFDNMTEQRDHDMGLVMSRGSVGKFDYRTEQSDYDMGHVQSRGSVDKFDNMSEKRDYDMGHVKNQGSVDKFDNRSDQRDHDWGHVEHKESVDEYDYRTEQSDYDMGHVTSRGSVDKFDNTSEQRDYDMGHVKSRGSVDDFDNRTEQRDHDMGLVMSRGSVGEFDNMSEKRDYDMGHVKNQGSVDKFDNRSDQRDHDWGRVEHKESVDEYDYRTEQSDYDMGHVTSRGSVDKFDNTSEQRDYDMGHVQSRGSVHEFDNRSEQRDYDMGHVKSRGSVDEFDNTSEQRDYDMGHVQSRGSFDKFDNLSEQRDYDMGHVKSRGSVNEFDNRTEQRDHDMGRVKSRRSFDEFDNRKVQSDHQRDLKKIKTTYNKKILKTEKSSERSLNDHKMQTANKRPLNDNKTQTSNKRSLTEHKIQTANKRLRTDNSRKTETSATPPSPDPVISLEFGGQTPDKIDVATPLSPEPVISLEFGGQLQQTLPSEIFRHKIQTATKRLRTDNSHKTETSSRSNKTLANKDIVKSPIGHKPSKKLIKTNKIPDKIETLEKITSQRVESVHQTLDEPQRKQPVAFLEFGTNPHLTSSKANKGIGNMTYDTLQAPKEIYESNKQVAEHDVATPLSPEPVISLEFGGQLQQTLPSEIFRHKIQTATKRLRTDNSHKTETSSRSNKTLANKDIVKSPIGHKPSKKLIKTNKIPDKIETLEKITSQRVESVHQTLDEPQRKQPVAFLEFGTKQVAEHDVATPPSPEPVISLEFGGQPQQTLPSEIFRHEVAERHQTHEQFIDMKVCGLTSSEGQNKRGTKRDLSCQSRDGMDFKRPGLSEPREGAHRQQGAAEETNPVCILRQYQQARKKKMPMYTVITEGGVPGSNDFIIQVEAGGVTCTGVGQNKKLTRRAAAAAMLLKLGYKPSPQSSKPAIKMPNVATLTKKQKSTVMNVDASEYQSLSRKKRKQLYKRERLKNQLAQEMKTSAAQVKIVNTAKTTTTQATIKKGGAKSKPPVHASEASPVLKYAPIELNIGFT